MDRPSGAWRPPMRWVFVLALGCALPLAGCSMVPRAQLEKCHALSRTLQADNSQLKNQYASLKSEHDDLAQRADDDARRLKAKEEENQRLLASVEAYQADRDKLATEFNRVKRLVQSSTNPLSATMRSRFEAFAKGHPECEFDTKSEVLTLASDPLFEPGTDRLKPAASALLKSLAALLDDSEARDIQFLVAGHTDDSPVRRAGLKGGPSTMGHLSLDRASRVRDLLTREGKVDPSRVEVAGFAATQPKADGLDDTARARNRRIEIHLRHEPSRAVPTAADMRSAAPG